MSVLVEHSPTHTHAVSERLTEGSLDVPVWQEDDSSPPIPPRRTSESAPTTLSILSSSTAAPNAFSASPGVARCTSPLTTTDSPIPATAPTRSGLTHTLTSTTDEEHVFCPANTRTSSSSYPIVKSDEELQPSLVIPIKLNHLDTHANANPIPTHKNEDDTTEPNESESDDSYEPALPPKRPPVSDRDAGKGAVCLPSTLDDPIPPGAAVSIPPSQSFASSAMSPAVSSGVFSPSSCFSVEPHSTLSTQPPSPECGVDNLKSQLEVTSLALPPLLHPTGKHDDPKCTLVAPPPSLQTASLSLPVSSASGSPISSLPSSSSADLLPRAASNVGSSIADPAPGLSPSPSGDRIGVALPSSIHHNSSFPFWIGCWNMGAKEMVPNAVANAPSPFAGWIPTGYKMYVIGLQESVSESTYKSLDAFFLQPEFDCTRMPIPTSSADGLARGTVKIEGRGDGSFIYPKCTSIAIWLQRNARHHVKYCAHGALSLGMTQGSKGGAAIALKVFDSTLVFVSCHLSSTTLASRRASYSSLIESVGNALGDGYFQLLEQFHHTFFLGDLNFRLRDGVTAPEAVKYMQRRDVRGLFAFDELSAEMNSNSAFGSFQEAPIDFFPTYKKHEGRTIPTPSKENIYWVHDVYKTIYKQPWYKSGNTAQRVPSWCDRIIRHSIADQRQRIRVLQFHPDEVVQADSSASGPASIKSVARIGGVGSLCTYRAFEDGLSHSDHTAVSCGFVLTLPVQVDWLVRNSMAAAHGVVAGLPTAHPASARNLMAAAGANPTRSASSSVSATATLGSRSPPPTVYIVRLHSVRVLQSPRQDISSPLLHSTVPIPSPTNLLHTLGGLEPKYVRVLFPAPFEAGAATPFASRQVTFGGATGINNTNNTVNDMNESSTVAQADQPPPVKAEFRCIAFEDSTYASASSTASSTVSASASSDPSLPSPAPFHLVLKIHSADDISGQCVIPLPRQAFHDRQVLEFHERMTRDGLRLTHPYTKQHMQVQFIVALDVARPTLNKQTTSPSPPSPSASTPPEPPVMVKTNSLT